MPFKKIIPVAKEMKSPDWLGLVTCLSHGSEVSSTQTHELRVGGKWPLKENQGAVNQKRRKRMLGRQKQQKPTQMGKCFLHLDTWDKINVQSIV